MVPKNSTLGGFAYIWQSKWVGIIAIKTERMQIHFLSDVLAVASLNLKVPIVSPPLWIFMFFFLQKSFILFSITRSSSFSAIHVSVNVKNNVEKDTTLLFYSFSKSGRPCDFFPNKTLSCISVATPLTVVCLWCGRTLGRSVGRCAVTWLPTFLRWVVYHIFLPNGAPLRARELRMKKKKKKNVTCNLSEKIIFFLPR